MHLNSRRFGILIRFKEDFRVDPADISNLLIQTKNAQLSPLSQIAEVKKIIGPLQINREKNQHRWMIPAMYEWFENKDRIKYEQAKYYEALGETT